jgi:uncharacterized protein (DUF305 family)
MTKNHRVTATTTALVVVLLTAGCTVSSPSMPGMYRPGGMAPSAYQAGFTMADSMFTMMMIPHHEQAIEMSDIILARSDVDQRVLDLARQIKEAQEPEIELMESWLRDWGMPSSRGMPGMHGMGHGSGMLSDNELAALAAAEGSEASRLFLNQMIVHHEGAIEMAQDELDDGINEDVRALAERIIASQTAEITTMKDLLTEI